MSQRANAKRKNDASRDDLYYAGLPLLPLRKEPPYE